MTDKRPQDRQPDDSGTKHLSNEPKHEVVHGEHYVEKYGQQSRNAENDPRGSGTGQTRDKEGG